MELFAPLCQDEIDTILSFHGKYRLILRRYYADYMKHLPIDEMVTVIWYDAPDMFLKILAESGRVTELPREMNASRHYGLDPATFMSLYKQRPNILLDYVPQGLTSDDCRYLLTHENMSDNAHTQLHIIIDRNAFSRIDSMVEEVGKSLIESKNARRLVRILRGLFDGTKKAYDRLWSRNLPFTTVGMDDLNDKKQLDKKTMNGARIGVNVTIGICEKKIRKLEEEVKQLKKEVTRLKAIIVAEER